MTTLAKIEANRRNARLSTGPRTAAGKLIVSANATTHGIFSRIPIVAGESPRDWEQHRAGVVASLAPACLLEVNLAERAALLLWQLARLGRYQASATTAAVEDAILLPPDADPAERAAFPAAGREDDYLKHAELNLRLARRGHADAAGTADLLRRLGDPAGLGPVDRARAEALLDYAYGAAAVSPLRRCEPESYTDADFLARIGGKAATVKHLMETPELLLRALDCYARGAGESPAEFRVGVQAVIDGRVAALAREVGRFEDEAAAIVRRSECRRARAEDAALLPPEQVVERVMRYERHLNGQLTSTLHELERLQSRRAGMPVIPPLAADVHLTVSAEPD